MKYRKNEVSVPDMNCARLVWQLRRRSHLAGLSDWLGSVIGFRLRLIDDLVVSWKINYAVIEGLAGQVDMKDTEGVAHHRTSSALLHRDKSLLQGAVPSSTDSEAPLPT